MYMEYSTFQRRIHVNRHSETQQTTHTTKFLYQEISIHAMSFAFAPIGACVRMR